MSIISMDVYIEQLKRIGIHNEHVNYQLSPEELISQTLQRNEGVLNDTGALCIRTGEFTGRSPQDKFTVKDSETENLVNWNNFNNAIDETHFDLLNEKLINFINRKNEIWVRDCYACADDNYRLHIRVISENPSSNLFASNMFIEPAERELENFSPGLAHYTSAIV